MSTFYLVDYVETDLSYSHITDLEVIETNGQVRLFATTLYDGSLTSWALAPSGLVLTDTVEYRGSLQAGSYASIMQVSVNGVSAILVGGGAASARPLQIFQIDPAGALSKGPTPSAAVVPLAGLTHGEKLTLANGNQAVYGGLAGADGIGKLVVDSSGRVVSATVIADRPDTFSADISAVATIKMGSARYVLTASGTQNGVTVWAVGPNGGLTPKDSLGTDDGLWIAAPTAMEVVTIGAKTFVVLASAGSSSLSVMSLDAAGQLQVTDHVIDSLNSRFASASAMTTVVHQGNTYVIAGGADDGISLFLLRSDGRLLARGHLADTTQMGLENVSAISAVSAGNGIDIFVASSEVGGITQLHFDTGPMGQTLKANEAGDVLTGGAGMDLIKGKAGADQLSGGKGDDIITDGAGADRLTGGQGADTFVFAYDDATDIIVDFEIGVDRIDLSAWPSLRSTAQLTFSARSDGVLISYGNDRLIVRSADGRPIDPASFGDTDLIGDARIAQNMPSGFSGPSIPIPVLPERPVYTPYVSTPAPTDPTPDAQVFIPTRPQVDTNTPSQQGTTGGGTTTSPTQSNIYGTGGADTLNGSADNNRIYGGAGNDALYGRGGNDSVYGGKGNDRLFGQSGADKIVGGAGGDVIKGGRGADYILGKGGNDKLTGGAGSDRLLGHNGKDRIKGGGGSDMLQGGNGRDFLKGGSGDDRLGGDGKADTLKGNGGNDKLWGGGGNDVLHGGNGDDIMTGGSGADTFIFNDGHDRITDFSVSTDTLFLDDKNWNGQLSAAEVVDLYAEVQGGNIVFDFGGNDELTLKGVTNLEALIHLISIV